MKRRVAILISGRGSNMVALIDAAKAADFPAEIYDHQSTYMATWLRMVGVTEIDQILVEKGLMGADLDAQARARGRAQAKVLAASL